MRNRKNRLYVISIAVLLMAGSCFASGRITGIQYINGWAELTVQTTPDKRYRIECCTDLASGEWTGVAGFTATASITVQEIASSASSCFFRVVEVEEAPIAPLPPPPTEPPPPPPPPPPTD